MLMSQAQVETGSSRILRAALWIGIPVAAAIAAILIFALYPSENLNLKQRIADLTDLRNALESYKSANGSYPPTPGHQWSGLYNSYGPSSEDWIPGLAPRFIKALPRDPRLSSAGDQQYLYKSDGTDFKLLSFFPEEDCKFISKNRPELLDPVRGGKVPGSYECHAYGYWTAGAAGW